LFLARARSGAGDRLADARGARLARQIARRRRTVLALRAAQRRVRALSNIDALTGLANRGVFERVLEREWARARREQRPVSLLVCDVDCFRQYDAHYGALAADGCLERVASIVAARSRRAGDLVARHGRDRFALLLPGASEFAALDIADSIRSDVFGLTLLHGASDAERVVTVSCGVATLTPGSADTAGTLTEAAMRALRCAKRAGRNRVRMAGATPAMDGR
jgi:diguanylate cyclase (GGDEF)-like protein